MSKIKVADLSGVELDYWVAMCLGDQGPWHPEPYLDRVEIERDAVIPHVYLIILLDPGDGLEDRRGFCPTENWSDCGPLIERFRILISVGFPSGYGPESTVPRYEAVLWRADGALWRGHVQSGSTPQIAICRAIVASVKGEEFEV